VFPNPQQALPLPRRATSRQVVDVAARLFEAGQREDDDAAVGAVVDEWLAMVSDQLGAGGQPFDRRTTVQLANQIEEFARRELTRAGAVDRAQRVVARCHGFADWPRLITHIDHLERGSSSFEAAVDAVVTGDEGTLTSLLDADPDLVAARSDREHDATLLVYTSANGVEMYRQRTPHNVVAIAEVLLDAGADIDATAAVYGGDCTTLGLVATSAFPRMAGVQIALLQLLVDRGARIEDRSTSSTVLSCLGNGCPEAAAYLAERGARVELAEAAGLGWREATERLLTTSGAPSTQLDEALLIASVYGHTAIADLLIGHGADLASTTHDGQTAAHQAVVAGRLDTLEMLLTHDPPLEQQNAYGGTVLEQALWSAAHGSNPDRSIEIIEALLRRGATLPGEHVPVNEPIDAFLATHGSRPEPAWHWYGEQPRADR
jgi:ankyrin repeat protein